MFKSFPFSIIFYNSEFNWKTFGQNIICSSVEFTNRFSDKINLITYKSLCMNFW
jgi:hypothetical protein